MADATSVLNEISGALDGAATQIIAVIPDDRSFMEIWGWSLPGVTRLDVADYVRRPRALISRIDTKAVTDEDLNRLQQVPVRIAYFLANGLANLPGGNAGAALSGLSGTIDALTRILEKYLPAPVDMQMLEDRRLFPAQQVRRLRNIDAGIDQLGVDSATLEEKIRVINAAHDVAEALPADMQSLGQARARYLSSEGEVARQGEEAARVLVEMHAAQKRISAAEEEAERVVGRAKAAFSAATTVGLGKEFAQRAASMALTTLVLGMVLVVTLGFAGWVTYNRVEFVHSLMLNPKIGYNILWLNLAFTAASVSAPVWLAWLLTRQIGQRFRMAEDYGYKASIAKAYEGYREEAARLDPDLEKRLFSIALDAIGEPPIRLVEKDSPGSPAHELKSFIEERFGKLAKPELPDFG